jgi:cation:H+ antiporter
MDLLLFLLSFAIILISCEFFTNGVEWVGRRFNLTEGCIGSVLAAVGTALPETMIPLIAILFVPGDAGSKLGTGAILGAPFMLSTLALFVCGLSVLVFRRRRGTNTLRINGGLIRRDLKFFLLAYGLAAMAAFLPEDLKVVKMVLGLGLFVLYGIYVWYTVRTGSVCEAELKGLYFNKLAERKVSRASNLNPADIEERKETHPFRPATALIILQVLLSLLGIIGGSYIFVEQIKELATEIAVPVILVALLISPVATELPEKFNSMLWIREKKDTYAIGNITGAMVFQSCIPVTIGLLLTPWVIDLGNPIEMLEALAMGIALLSGVILFWRSSQVELKMSGLMFGGLLYIFFFLMVLFVV